MHKFKWSIFNESHCTKWQVIGLADFIYKTFLNLDQKYEATSNEPPLIKIGKYYLVL